MRFDGRQADEMRLVKITPGYLEYAEGSALIGVGQTRVVCTATLEDRVPLWLKDQNQGWVTAEYAMLPRSTRERTPRETLGLGGRTQEIRRLIGRSLRAGVDLRLLGTRTVVVDCDVLQADGGTRTAAITGGYVAVAMALRRLIKEGLLPPGVLLAAVAAVSVGVVQDEPLLDLTYEEDVQAQVDFNVVMTAEGEYVEVQGTGEGSPFAGRTMDRLLELAKKGIEELVAAQKESLSKGQ